MSRFLREPAIGITFNPYDKSGLLDKNFKNLNPIVDFFKKLKCTIVNSDSQLTSKNLFDSCKDEVICRGWFDCVIYFVDSHKVTLCPRRYSIKKYTLNELKSVTKWDKSHRKWDFYIRSLDGYIGYEAAKYMLFADNDEVDRQQKLELEARMLQEQKNTDTGNMFIEMLKRDKNALDFITNIAIEKMSEIMENKLWDFKKEYIEKPEEKQAPDTNILSGRGWYVNKPQLTSDEIYDNGHL